MQRVIFGTPGNEQLSLNNTGNLFGFSGDDTLVASSGVSDFYLAFMVGGEGNDHYIVNSLAAVIVDTGGNDKLTLSGALHQYISAYVNGQDLTLINTTTGQEVFIVDAKSRGRIDTFEFASGEVLSSAEMEQRVYSHGYGDISYAEYNPNLSAQHFLEVKEINKAWADLDWGSVWQAVTQQGEVTNQGVASAVNDALTSMLSPSALQQWQAQGGPQQLAASQFEGVEQNLPATPAPSPILPREVIENIALIYEAALNRQPDEAGLNYWIDVAMQGQSTIDISGFFIQSDEFLTNFGAPSNNDFIDRMYLNVLDRNADAAGKTYWLDQMATGLTQAEVLNYFAVSQENIDNAAWLSGLAETDSGWVI
ncbi:MAG TPA: hypothetical protein DEO68_16135 [Halomonas campaniensis]|uniref:DUF4214 domain-containing protein n=1 Tax=Halomonas campaniensis TaxID=213554 RepID=A0A3D0KJG9_9GAMM|nr:DUF4214 domain-containing protein [Halomonas sp. 3F2F]HCA03654.1 hypothetical protein [Halomonas campaniensis]